MLDDWRTAPVDDRVRAVLGFLDVFAVPGEPLQAAHFEPLRAAGLNDDAIRDAMYASWSFQNLTRWADAFDWPLASDERLQRIGRFLHRMGYAGGSLRG